MAYSSLRRLVERLSRESFTAPGCRAAHDRSIKNRLSDYENYVADYYLRRGAYVSPPLNRAKGALGAVQRSGLATP